MGQVHRTAMRKGAWSGASDAEKKSEIWGKEKDDAGLVFYHKDFGLLILVILTHQRIFSRNWT